MSHKLITLICLLVCLGNLSFSSCTVASRSDSKNTLSIRSETGIESEHNKNAILTPPVTAENSGILGSSKSTEFEMPKVPTVLGTIPSYQAQQNVTIKVDSKIPSLKTFKTNKLNSMGIMGEIDNTHLLYIKGDVNDVDEDSNFMIPAQGYEYSPQSGILCSYNILSEKFMKIVGNQNNNQTYIHFAIVNKNWIVWIEMSLEDSSDPQNSNKWYLYALNRKTKTVKKLKEADFGSTINDKYSYFELKPSSMSIISDALFVTYLYPAGDKIASCIAKIDLESSIELILDDAEDAYDCHFESCVAENNTVIWVKMHGHDSSSNSIALNRFSDIFRLNLLTNSISQETEGKYYYQVALSQNKIYAIDAEKADNDLGYITHLTEFDYQNLSTRRIIDKTPVFALSDNILYHVYVLQSNENWVGCFDGFGYPYLYHSKSDQFIDVYGDKVPQGSFFALITSNYVFASHPNEGGQDVYIIELG
ncbi:hypothetical protein HCH52_03080 [Oscillospiraceae bacterium HV4-5-C5C]|nr:hypothetical protein [Oscillospiraceae bacterium HV4-5-C5C]